MSDVTKFVPDLANPGKMKLVWSEFTKTAKMIMEEAMALNDRGVHFPVFGICLGFEAMVAVAADDLEIVEKCEKCLGYNANVEFKDTTNSRFLSALPEELRNFLRDQKCTRNYHSYKVDPEKFAQNPRLTAVYRVVGLSPASDESFNFVSIIEGRRYPFYGVQFHPELGARTYFSLDAVGFPDLNKTARVAQAMMNFIREEASKNENRVEFALAKRTGPDWLKTTRAWWSASHASAWHITCGTKSIMQLYAFQS